MSEPMIVDDKTPKIVERQTPTTPVVQAQINTEENNSKPQKPQDMETSTPQKQPSRRKSLTSQLSENSQSHHSTLSPYKYLTESTRHGGPVTGTACPSEMVKGIVGSILNSKAPKQSAEITAKSLLFLKTRDTVIVSSPFELTPSVEYQKCCIFDEIKHRSATQRIAKDLVEFVAKERRKGFIYDEIFNQLRSEIIYTSYNFISAFFNNHAIGTVDQLTLAIQCVHLACKSQSNFKRLEKLVQMARSRFQAAIFLDKNHYADIEMMVLQSIGFQMQIADDYPHKYIYQFNSIMKEKFKCFKANEKKMLTLCHCAIHISTILVETSPIMLNRESSTVAAACILVANDFKPVMEIADWWKYLTGCEKLEYKELKETSDLIFDTLKYNQVNWANLSIQPLEIDKNLFRRSNSNSTGSSPIQTSPPQQMLSPISGISETCSSGFGSESSTRLNDRTNLIRPKRSEINFRQKLEKTTTTASSSSPFSKPDLPKNRLIQSPLVKSNNFNCSFAKTTRTNSIPNQLMLSPQTFKVVKNSEIVPKSQNDQETTNSSSSSSKNTTKSIPPPLNFNITAEKSSASSENNNNNQKMITSQVSTESSIFTPLSTCSSGDGAVFDLNMSVDSSSSCASSSYSSISHNSSLSSYTASLSLHLSGAVKHPDEIKYTTRLEAIKQNTEITRFYACSKDRYNTLTREEKNFVKAFKQKVKHRRDLLQQKKLERGKKRRKSAYPVMMQTGSSEVTNNKSSSCSDLSVNANATEMITTTENNNNSLNSIPEAKRQKM